ncbi:sulphate transporter [Beutenbergia cavernae DSM 12333]|uniref:Sulphate transporter n=1 Tax=Beutenbergia cavernae (strain ATCC BAA-8 / DSM 12333 / CCUG 43141 / JCM 11478 / NBRC 16432 / NCIMB 13614 / HKI 0122) TaxID=471853 RepID=C5BYR8_BEUC1|nr:SulP family inorganic anion transporter [Beutenbergia cavernae]ACQ79026.1 sulphate transporter [Beutenbergia cavernae DSM 12333]
MSSWPAPSVAPTGLGRAWLLPTLRGYDRRWIGGDVVGGLAAGAVVVPQAMAYATIAGLPVTFGLYTCMVPMLVYALLGGSTTLSMSTTSTIATLSATTLLTAGIVAGADDPSAALCTLTLLVGLALLLARVLRLGGLVENISQATVIGIKTGVGATVAAGQLPKLLGVEPAPEGTGFFGVVRAAIAAFDQVNVPTLLLSVASVAALVLLARFVPRLPAPLVVVAGGILLVALAGIADRGVALIDPVEPGLPHLVLPDVGVVSSVLPGALAIAVMAFLETVSVARGVRRRSEPQIDPNRELFANGVAATVGAFTQAMPPAGGFSQTAVNQRAGARSQLAGIVTMVLAVAVALFLAPVLDDLPQATLGAMVFVATLGLINLREFSHLWRLNRTEFVVAALTAVVGLVVGLLAAVGVGVVLTLFLVLRELDRPRVVPLVARDGGGWAPLRAEVDEPQTVRAGDATVLALHLDGGLYTANVRPTADQIVAWASVTRPDAVVLEVDAMRMLTSTVVGGLRDLDRELGDLGARLYLTRVPPDVQAAAAESSWFSGLRDSGRVLETVDDALAAIGARSPA